MYTLKQYFCSTTYLIGFPILLLYHSCTLGCKSSLRILNNVYGWRIVMIFVLKEKKVFSLWSIFSWKIFCAESNNETNIKSKNLTLECVFVTIVLKLSGTSTKEGWTDTALIIMNQNHDMNYESHCFSFVCILVPLWMRAWILRVPRRMFSWWVSGQYYPEILSKWCRVRDCEPRTSALPV